MTAFAQNLLSGRKPPSLTAAMMQLIDSETVERRVRSICQLNGDCWLSPRGQHQMRIAFGIDLEPMAQIPHFTMRSSKEAIRPTGSPRVNSAEKITAAQTKPTGRTHYVRADRLGALHQKSG